MYQKMLMIILQLIKDEDKTIASALNIPYRYTKGFYSLHTGIYTNKGNEAALYYRFVTRVEKDIVLEVYGASYKYRY